MTLSTYWQILCSRLVIEMLLDRNYVGHREGRLMGWSESFHPVRRELQRASLPTWIDVVYGSAWKTHERSRRRVPDVQQCPQVSRQLEDK